uniref:Retrotransposon gag domain-containing protein n=2 Tax=Chenopodium quinoa TaxID=63459 RepID=A0A803N896_CHEQI
MKLNGVTDDALRLRLFPFSLRDRAKEWLRDEGSGSFDTWDKLVKAFLVKFLGQEKTARLRNELSTFRQSDEESLYDAWRRFKRLQRQCPHHGIPEWMLIQTFYNGLTHEFRIYIDAASGGSLLTKNPTEAKELMSQRKRTRSTPQQQPQLDLESVTGCPHVVFVPEFPNQKQRFIELSRRKVIPTRFFDRSLLSKLGIDSECKNLFAKLGMSQLFNMNYRTYEDLTLEFLSSFDIEKGRNGLVKYVVYRLLNRSHRMSLEGFARKFGLPCTGLTVQPSSFISGELWFAMTGENIESFQHALSHKIHQPVLRLWTRFTGWTIFGRIEPNNVRSDEISILGSYLRRGDEDGDFKMNIAHLFALHLKKQGTTYTTIKSNGERSNIPIVLGGLVTHLALREGFDEASRCPVPGPITLDQHYLTTAGWLSIDFNRFSWIIGRTNRLSVPLPSPDLTKIMPHQPSYLLQFPSDSSTPVPAAPTRTYFRREELRVGQLDLSTRVQTIETNLRELNAGQQDFRLSMYPVYDYFCRQGYIPRDGPHPSWYHFPGAGDMAGFLHGAFQF